MSDNHDTVELPANREMKQLAHDVVQDENEELVPVLLDFYEFLAELNTDTYSSLGNLRVRDPNSAIAGETWTDLLDAMVMQDLVDKNAGQRSYTLELPESEN